MRRAPGHPVHTVVLEDRFKKDMNEEEAIELAIRAIKAAMRRDAGSGEGIHVVIITKEKYMEIADEQIQKALTAISA